MSDAVKELHIRGKCGICKEIWELPVRASSYEAWKSGEIKYVQDAFPDIPPNKRELLLTGYHGECIDKLSPEDEEESVSKTS